MTRGGTVYILASRPNGTLYIGVTNDLVRRVGEHRTGTTEGFTSEHGVTRLVYFERHDDIRDAIARETRLKKWNRAWKLKLIREANPDERDLYGEVCSHPGTPLSMPMDSRLRGNDRGGGAVLSMLLILLLAAPAMGQGSALARWTLASVPPNAVLLADAADTDALLALQAAGLRPDVQVTRASDAPGLAATWATSARPVVGTLMLDPEVFGRVAPMTVSAGAYQRPGPADAPAVDLAASEASAGGVRGADFAAPPVGVVDLGGVVLFGLLQTAVSHAQAGDRDSAERGYARAATFARDAGRPADPLVATARAWIDDALAAPPPAAPVASDLE